MQIFERKSTTKMAYLYTLQNTIFQRTHARMRYSFTIRQLRQLNINFNQLFILALYQVVSPLVDIVFNQSLAAGVCCFPSGRVDDLCCLSCCSKIPFGFG